jgi:hypothetical protein
LETFKKNIEANYSFLLQDFEGEGHDYFLQNQKPDLAVSYLHAKLLKKEEIKAEIFIAVHEDFQAFSLPGNPFGGFWTADNISSEALSFFINQLKDALAKRGVLSLTVIQPPKEYNFQSDLVSYLMFSAGFKLVKVMSHQVLCGKKKLKRLAENLDGKYAKKSKALDIETSTESIQNFNFLHNIGSWNQSRGYKSTFSEDRLIRQVSFFPDRYFLITIHQNEQPLGHALAVKLTSDSLYYFLSAINPKDQHSLTGELIMAQLVKLAAKQKVDFLDFGTSDLEHEPNHNLMFFKSRYANEYSNKYTWQINFK